ncbi:M23 family metallopeptidase [Pseudonocardia broussonetiae]|uniref:M23 family metallopeptidase n=1 Tax=Pseudonocardia broussonetiae TaxID=2736640 RepID=UPI001F03DE77|nr:M23 family metallopeptidase [Pseudonocardia broussonetiae]
MTAPLRVVTVPGVHRLPAPPAASLRGRVTVAAVATGAVVAAGQTAVAPLLEAAEPPPVAMSALLPVAEVSEASFPVDAIGGDQVLPGALATVGLDPESQVDVQNLTKAVEIGQELARRDAILTSALSFGAPLAHLVGDQAFVQPTIGRFTSGFGGRWGTHHNGIDIANAIGTPIYAVTDGVVEESGPASGFGLWVVLRHADGTKSVYGHINRAIVQVGDEVAAGQQIAELGNRGFSTGPHLHFEIHDANDRPMNPRPWLEQHGIDGF